MKNELLQQLTAAGITSTAKSVIISIYSLGGNGQQTLITTKCVDSQDVDRATGWVRKLIDQSMPDNKLVVKGELVDRLNLASLQEVHARRINQGVHKV